MRYKDFFRREYDSHCDCYFRELWKDFDNRPLPHRSFTNHIKSLPFARGHLPERFLCCRRHLEKKR